METAIIFTLIGICFGVNWSLDEVDTFDFMLTRRWKKIVRAIIGVGIAWGIWEIFLAIPDRFKLIYI